MTPASNIEDGSILVVCCDDMKEAMEASFIAHVRGAQKSNETYNGWAFCIDDQRGVSIRHCPWCGAQLETAGPDFTTVKVIGTGV